MPPVKTCLPAALLLLVALATAMAGKGVWAGDSAASSGRAIVLEVQGAIGPAMADYIERGIRDGAAEGAPIVVLRIDTPGGLDASMRQIVKAILASPVAVAAFVAPQGARAASAGTFILYASHVAAMAPGTNLGAATPVAIGLPGTEKGEPGEGKKPASMAKAESDAAAYIRGLAQLRGRNAAWAERAVLEAASLSADEALREQVVDVVAADVQKLLAALDGRSVHVAGGTLRLALAGVAVREIEPDWRTRLLLVITNPSVAIVLMMLGIYGLFFEFASPGFGVPGVVGAICLLLALFAFQMLPVNYAGVALLALGIALMAAEAFFPGFGVLGAGGVIAFIAGGILLVRGEAPGLAVPVWLTVALAATSAAVAFVAARLALAARRRPVVSGAEEMVGAQGSVYEAQGSDGWALVRGERWRIQAAGTLRVGERIRVVGVRGLTLEVAEVPQDQTRR